MSTKRVKTVKRRDPLFDPEASPERFELLIDRCRVCTDLVHGQWVTHIVAAPAGQESCNNMAVYHINHIVSICTRPWTTDQQCCVIVMSLSCHCHVVLIIYSTIACLLIRCIFA